MTSRKRKPSSSIRRRMIRLERGLAAVEAQIAQLERNKGLGVTMHDHFADWQRASLFVTSRSGEWH